MTVFRNKDTVGIQSSSLEMLRPSEVLTHHWHGYTGVFSSCAHQFEYWYMTGSTAKDSQEGFVWM